MPEPPQISPPAAAFSASAQTGAAPLTVVFTNASTGVITGYAWSFGDGTVSDKESPTHEYEEPGNFVVSLTVFNSAGSDTETYRIDVESVASPIAPERAETILDLIPSIRAGLRRPSEQKLRYQDIKDVIYDLLRGYSRDLHVSEQNHRTDESQCVLSPLGGSDYLLTVPGVSEVEVEQLRFLPRAQINQLNQVWTEVTVVPLDYYTDRHQRDAAVAAFYGGLVLDTGVKVKLNLARETVENSIWKVRHRIPLLKLLTLSSRTPLPADMLPMIKVEAQMICLPRMRDDSKEFYAWRRANEPIFAAQIRDWRKRWDEFLNSNTEPEQMPKIPFNSYRNRSRRMPKYTIEPRNT